MDDLFFDKFIDNTQFTNLPEEVAGLAVAAEADANDLIDGTFEELQRAVESAAGLVLSNRESAASSLLSSPQPESISWSAGPTAPSSRANCFFLACASSRLLAMQSDAFDGFECKAMQFN